MNRVKHDYSTQLILFMRSTDPVPMGPHTFLPTLSGLCVGVRCIGGDCAGHGRFSSSTNAFGFAICISAVACFLFDTEARAEWLSSQRVDATDLYWSIFVSNCLRWRCPVSLPNLTALQPCSKSGLAVSGRSTRSPRTRSHRQRVTMARTAGTEMSINERADLAMD